MRIFVCLTTCLWLSTGMACTKDTDCKGDRICVEGACAAAATTAPIEASVPEGGTKSFHFNILGLLQFGLTPTLEWGSQNTFLARARLLNTGALPYLMASAEDEDFVFGLGLSGQYRRYLGSQSQAGAFLGGGLEILYGQNEGEETYETYYVVPQLEGGHRWANDGYFTSVGAFFGVALPIESAGYDDTESVVSGGFHWDIGWYL